MASSKKKLKILCWGACVSGVTRCGMNYPSAQGERRAEEGDVVDDVPIQSHRWLIEGGHAEQVGADTPVTGSRDATAAAIEAHKALVAAGLIAPVEGPIVEIGDLSGPVEPAEGEGE
jgi:hypothetical protein